MSNHFIQKLKGFGPLADEDIVALENVTKSARKVAARTDLIREGDRPGPLFVVLDGWAQRYKILPNGTRQIVAFLLPGDACDLHVGTLAEMDHSIQTVKAARIATIANGVLDDLMDRHRNIRRAMYRAQLTDEGTLRAWIVSMGRRTSIERVAHLMCELYLRASRIGLIDGEGFELPLSQIMLADALGMTPVHINRVLKDLRSRAAMEIRRGTMVIQDPVMLAQIAGFDENYLHRRLRQIA
ncbi:Crp/Fnr family transcriptional regulator [Sphingomonas prati]|uniref:CRP-like cAMP-binding protein n=1 Tax=Sphingomonas prati TaxID=1843237 RepID=A0A7W9F096_9SPHN|nr:Crp/Fnr family transcriptional regulator [Sphingomonas prati]MBB5728013.1 CRP-like cAMP-binding protein [Sphingomonas prati]GGE82600.1 Crp/Fnr family transcriptional regulator [Sphingomonas prati]